LSGFLLKSGVGLLAPRAWALIENRLWFLGPNGIYEYDGGETVTPVSIPIEDLLNPAQSGGAAITASAYAQSSMVYHGRRLYLIAPTAGDSAPTVAYVYDTRQNGWTRYLNMSMTGSVSLSTAADTDDLFLAGQDGQIYQLSYAQAGDKATPSAAATAITWTFKSRGFGRELMIQEQWHMPNPDWWRENRGIRAYTKISLGEAASVVQTAGAVGTSLTSAITHTMASGTAQHLRDEINRAVRGDAFYVQVSGSTVTTTKITAVACEIVKGAIVSRT
jgi:hypothetical protein